MEELTLKPVTETNWRAITELKPLSHQMEWINTNAESLLEAVYEPRFNWSVYGLYADSYPIGFAMIGAYNEERKYIWLDRFMIDGQFQGRGYGKKFLAKILTFIQSNWIVDDIVLSIEKDNQVAKIFYEKFGFKNTGRIDEENGEWIMVLKTAGNKI